MLGLTILGSLNSQHLSAMMRALTIFSIFCLLPVTLLAADEELDKKGGGEITAALIVDEGNVLQGVSTHGMYSRK